MRPRWLAGVLAAAVMAPVAATAQDVRGAQRIEIDSAVFGGGELIVPSSVSSESRSQSYVVSGAVTANLNKWVGVEGEVGWGLGHRETHEVYGLVNRGPRVPNILMYGGGLVYNPLASDRPVIPYVTAGVGALTTFAVLADSGFGLPGDSTYLTMSAGSGVRWFPIRHWGLRGDYRFVHIQNDAGEPAPGQRIVRSAHRLYGALVLTF